MNVDPIVLVVIVAYMILMLGIGWRVSYAAHDISDFLLAKRSLGKWIVAMSLMFSAWSGYTFTGMIGVGYVSGLKAVWIGLASLGGLLFGAYLAYSMRLRPLSVALDALTVPDILAKRYYDKGNVVRFMSSLLVGFLFTGVVAPQLLAIGVVLNSISGIDVAAGAWIGLVIVVAYTVMGGFRAAAYTDFAQGIVVLVAGLVLLIAAWAASGGVIPGLIKSNAVAGAGYSDPIGDNLLGNMNLLIVFFFTWPGLLHMAIRFMSVNKNTEIKPMFWIAVAVSFIVAFPLILGTALMRGLMPEVQPAQRESLVFLFSLKYLPAWFSGLFVAGFLGAVMSTVDSALMVGASAFVRDFLKGIFMPNMTNRQEVLYTRIAIVVVAVLAMEWILIAKDSVLALIVFANSLLASGIGVPLVFACWWKRATKQGAIASMIFGPLAVIVWKSTGMSNFLVESAFGFITSSIVMVVVSLLTAPPPVEITTKLDKALGFGILGKRPPSLSAQPGIAGASEP